MHPAVSSNRRSLKPPAERLNQLNLSSKANQQSTTSKIAKEQILKMIEKWEAENNETFEADNEATASEEGLVEIDDVEDTPEANEEDAMNDIRQRQRMIEQEIKERVLSKRRKAKNQEVRYKRGQCYQSIQKEKIQIVPQKQSIPSQSLAIKDQDSEREQTINRWVSLVLWVVGLETIGILIGMVSGSASGQWFKHINLPPLQPPGWVFGVAWTILYALIAVGGWILQYSSETPKVLLLRGLYWFQLILNWSWSFVFFTFHLTAFSFAILVVMDVSVGLLVYLAYGKLRLVSLLMLPYLLWLLFASYLNFYIWQNNPNPIHVGESIIGGQGMRYTHQTLQTWTSPNGEYRKTMEEYSKML